MIWLAQRDQARAERDAAVAALQSVYTQACICDGENAKLRHEWVRERCREVLAQLPHAGERARLIADVVAAAREICEEHIIGKAPVCRHLRKALAELRRAREGKEIHNGNTD